MPRTKTTFTGKTAPKAVGGKRAGAGRKPNIVKKALEDFLEGKIGFNVKGTKIKTKGKTVMDLCRIAAVQALVDRDDAGRVTTAGARVLTECWDRRYGKARQTVEVSGHIGGLAAALSTAERAAAEGDLQDVLGGG